MTNSIWVIQSSTEHEGYNGSYDLYEIDQELGYFLSKEDAEKFITQRTEQENREDYERYVSELERRNAESQRAYDETLRKNKVLADHGFSVGRTNWSPTNYKVQSFETWLKAGNGVTFYAVELKPNGESV